MIKRKGYGKGYVLIALTIGSLAIGGLFVNGMLLSNPQPTAVDIMLTGAVVMMILIASALMMQDVHFNMYSYQLEDDRVVIKKLFRRYEFPYRVVTHVKTTPIELLHGTTLRAIRHIGYRVTICSEQYKTTIQLAQHSDEKKILTALRRNVALKVRTTKTRKEKN